MMDFQGPVPADYENVRSLNLAFFELLQKRETGRRYLSGLAPELAYRLQRMSRLEMGRLAAVPFLLFSLRECDDSLWRKMLTDEPDRDLFTVLVNPTEDARRLMSAGLGFVWQLANRNPFAARILCGASTHWCEQIAEQTFLDILAVAGAHADLLRLRACDDNELWGKLLGDGLSAVTEIRQAARISALHYVLTRQTSTVALSAAACASRSPALKVAENPKL